MIKYFLCSFLFLGLFNALNAQNCTLSIGGKDKDVIVQVFQLNDEQQGKLSNWQGELEVKTKILEDQMKLLLAEHPQSEEDDLMLLAKKYKKLEKEMVELTMTYDKKLLAVFNDKQYTRYTNLCKEALREPLRVERVVVPE